MGGKRSRRGDSFLLVVLEARATFCGDARTHARTPTHGAGARVATARITVIQTGGGGAAEARTPLSTGTWGDARTGEGERERRKRDREREKAREDPTDSH